MPEITAAANLPSLDAVAPIVGTVGTAVAAAEIGKNIADQMPGEIGKTSRRIKIPFIGRDKTTTPNTPKEPEPYRIIEPLTQEKVQRSGDPEQQVKWDKDLIKFGIDKLDKARQDVQRLQSQNPDLVLSRIDRMLLDEELAGRIARKELKGADMYLVQNVILNELILRQIATARLVRQNPSAFEPFGNLPFIGRLVSDGGTTLEDLQAINPAYLDNYIRVQGYSTAHPMTIEHQLRDLHAAYKKIEASFYRNGRRNPLADRILDHTIWARRRHDPIYDYRNGEIYMPSADSTPVGTFNGVPLYRTAVDAASNQPRFDSITKMNQNIPHDAIVEQISGPRGIIAEMMRREELPPNTTFETVFNNNPILAYRILYEANQNATVALNGELALRILKGERRNTDTTAITQRATELRTSSTTAEDLTPLEEAKTKAEAEITEAETKLVTLRADLPIAEQSVRTTETAQKKAKEIYNDTEARYGGTTGQIERLKTQSTELTHYLSTLPPATTPATKNTLSPAETIRQTIRDIEDKISSYEDKLAAARDSRINADIDHESAKNHLDRLKGIAAVAAVGTTPAVVAIPGEIADTENRLTAAKTAAKKAKDTFDAKVKEVGTGGVSPEREQMAKAEERWITVSNNRPIIDTAILDLKQTEFTPATLSDTSTTIEGKIRGLDAIHKLIFQTIDKKSYNSEVAELAEKMLSEEAVAMGIFEAMTFDPNTVPITVHGPITLSTTVAQMMEDIRVSKTIINSIPDATDPRRIANETRMRTYSREMLLAALPMLRNMQQLEIVEVINKIIDRGLRSAENGEPYLTYVT